MTDLLETMCDYFGDAKRCISITGSGGKTSALIALARFYAQLGNRVLLSTTTKLELPSCRAYDCDAYFFDDSILTYTPSAGQRIFYAQQGTQKALAPEIKTLEILKDRYDVLLLEADGARHNSLKLHTNFDPVIPDFTTATLAIAGMQAWNEKLADCCFGWDEDKESIFDADTLAYLVSHQRGILKEARGTTLVLLNQADTLQMQSMSSIIETMRGKPCILGSLQTNIVYRKQL